MDKIKKLLIKGVEIIEREKLISFERKFDQYKKDAIDLLDFSRGLFKSWQSTYKYVASKTGYSVGTLKKWHNPQVYDKPKKGLREMLFPEEFTKPAKTPKPDMGELFYPEPQRFVQIATAVKSNGEKVLVILEGVEKEYIRSGSKKSVRKYREHRIDVPFNKIPIFFKILRSVVGDFPILKS